MVHNISGGDEKKKSMIFSSTSAGHNKPKLSQLRLGPACVPVFTSNYMLGVPIINILATNHYTMWRGGW